MCSKKLDDLVAGRHLAFINRQASAGKAWGASSSWCSWGLTLICIVCVAPPAASGCALQHSMTSDWMRRRRWLTAIQCGNSLLICHTLSMELVDHRLSTFHELWCKCHSCPLTMHLIKHIYTDTDQADSADEFLFYALSQKELNKNKMKLKPE